MKRVCLDSWIMVDCIVYDSILEYIQVYDSTFLCLRWLVGVGGCKSLFIGQPGHYAAEANLLLMRCCSFPSPHQPLHQTPPPPATSKTQNPNVTTDHLGYLLGSLI